LNVATRSSGKVRVAQCASWKPGDSGQVDLMAVEDHVLQACKGTGNPPVSYDPWQCALMAQRLQRQGVWMVEVPFVPANLDKFAKSLLVAFRNHKVELFPDPDLIRDLERLSIVERSYGYKLEAVSDEEGHADRAIALAMLLPESLVAADDPSFGHVPAPRPFGDFAGRVFA
jgi:hypothetical protein